MPSTISLFERVRHAGCWAIGLYAFALFFAFGALASLFNGDLLTTVWGIVLAALAAGLGIWLARKANRK